MLNFSEKTVVDGSGRPASKRFNVGLLEDLVPEEGFSYFDRGGRDQIFGVCHLFFVAIPMEKP